MFDRSRFEEIRGHYEPRIGDARADHEILDWASAESQRARFEVLTRHVDLAGKKLLDVGCGLGQLWAFLKERGVACDYTGVDLLDSMLAAAQKRHPLAHFIHADIFAQDVFPPESFDVAFASGIFNLRLGNNMQFLPRAVERLLGLCRQCVVINLLHSRTPNKEERYCYYDPDTVEPILQAIPCRTEMIQGYLPNDFTVICRA